MKYPIYIPTIPQILDALLDQAQYCVTYAKNFLRSWAPAEVSSTNFRPLSSPRAAAAMGEVLSRTGGPQSGGDGSNSQQVQEKAAGNVSFSSE